MWWGEGGVCIADFIGMLLCLCVGGGGGAVELKRFK